MAETSARLKLIIAYDGAAFAGWQSQSHRNTVQDCLTQAAKRICRKSLHMHGAGRTDAGVHALAQCAHMDVPNRRLATEDWQRALNANLPPTVRILRCAYVPTAFHARFSAKAKTYRYRIWNGELLPPFELERAWHIPRRMDFALATKATALFRGTHDFRAFAANRGKVEENTCRTIYSSVIRRHGPLITIQFDGDGFLYKMVRLMVGAVVQCSFAKLRLGDIGVALATGRPSTLRVAAPGEGLFLVRVRY